MDVHNLGVETGAERIWLVAFAPEYFNHFGEIEFLSNSVRGEKLRHRSIIWKAP